MNDALECLIVTGNVWQPKGMYRVQDWIDACFDIVRIVSSRAFNALLEPQKVNGSLRKSERVSQRIMLACVPRQMVYLLRSVGSMGPSVIPSLLPNGAHQLLGLGSETYCIKRVSWG